jgi:hypothetical protein
MVFERGFRMSKFLNTRKALIAVAVLFFMLALAGAVTASAFAKSSKPKPVKVSICHVTSDAVRPYRLITVSEKALKGHSKHGDLVPAPAEGCPATLVTATPIPTTEPTVQPTGEPTTEPTTQPVP